MRLRVAVAIGFLVVAVAVGLAAQVANERPLTSGRAAILGRVVEAGTQTGIGEVIVTLAGGALGAPGGTFDSGVPAGPRRIATDAQGRFVFLQLPAGSYTLTARAAGHTDGAWEPAALSRLPSSLRTSPSLDVTSTDGAIQVTIELSQTAGIGGRVVDETGEPVVGVPVTVLRRTLEWGAPLFATAATTTSDDRGMYHVDVTAGEYVAGVVAATTTAPASAVEAFLSAQRDGGETMQAFMRDVAGAAGFLPRGVGLRVGAAFVTQFGAMNVPVVPPPSPGERLFFPSAYHPAGFSAASATVVAVASGEERGGVDILVRRLPFRVVAGRVIDTDGPAVHLGLTLVPAGVPGATAEPPALRDTPRAMTDASGQFSFVGVAPGRYALMAARWPTATVTAGQVIGAGAGTELRWAHQDVQVADADVRGIDLRLERGVAVRGRLVFEGAAPPAPDQLRRLTIELRALPGTIAELANASRRPPFAEITDDRFVTQEYAPGSYWISVSRLPTAWIVKSATVGGQDAVDRLFELSPAGSPEVVVVLTQRMSELSGVVRDKAGAPAAHTVVVVFPVDRALWPVPGMPSRRVAATASGRDGRYRIGNLPAGEYFVLAADDVDVDFPSATSFSRLSGSATRVTVGDGTAHTRDVRVGGGR